jgi:lipid II:glycine glycyltransferase (peptidoglycan interpeptide bridge formation enzyme)
MVYYRKKIFTSIAEIWYNFSEKPEKATDVFRYKFVTENNPNAASYEKLFTILIDLTKNKDEIFLDIRKNSRYEINRARDKDSVICAALLKTGTGDFQALSQYISFFNQFALSKGRSRINYTDLEQFFTAKNLCIRYVSKDDEILTMHAYVISDNTARLHQSSSLFRSSENSDYRNMVARANRYLHWDDILYFKKLGLSWYDLGGWYGGNENKEQLAINVFKESFGGQLKEEYSYIVPRTLKGKISVFFHSLLNILKSIIKLSRQKIKSVHKKQSLSKDVN